MAERDAGFSADVEAEGHQVIVAAKPIQPARIASVNVNRAPSYMNISTDLRNGTRAKVVVATTIALTFISFWRAAAVVLNDMASTMFYIGGITEQAIGKPAPEGMVMLFSFAVRSVWRAAACSSAAAFSIRRPRQHRPTVAKPRFLAGGDHFDRAHQRRCRRAIPGQAAE